MNDKDQERVPDTPRSEQDGDGAPVNGAAPVEGMRERLLRDAHKYRLPPELKEQILRELPPYEVREQGYRELIESGGHTFEELIASLPEDMRAIFDERTE